MRQEIGSIPYEIKWKLQNIDKDSLGNRCEINGIRYEINKNLQKIDKK